jgi:hypothetical protein
MDEAYDDHPAYAPTDRQVAHHIAPRTNWIMLTASIGYGVVGGLALGEALAWGQLGAFALGAAFVMIVSAWVVCAITFTGHAS